MSTLKVFLGVGHQHGGKDSGAVGYVVEKNINLKMALACRDYLEMHGVIVGMSRTKDEDDPLTEEIKECNAFNPDLAVDIHNNAGGGDGFEAYYSISGGTGKTLAANLEAEVKRIGQNSRGIKTRKNSAGKDYYGFIRQTKCPAVIVEGVFVDNKADAAQADTDAECKAFGEAYAKGILKTLNVKKEQKNITVTVIASKLNCRNKAGMNANIVAIFDKGTKLTLKDKSNPAWYKVMGKYKGKYVTGYCASKYLE